MIAYLVQTYNMGNFQKKIFISYNLGNILISYNLGKHEIKKKIISYILGSSRKKEVYILQSGEYLKHFEILQSGEAQNFKKNI